MNVNVVRNANGQVVATFEDGKPGGPSLQPVLEAGHTVSQVNAPDNYRANLKDFYAQNSHVLAKAGH